MRSLPKSVRHFVMPPANVCEAVTLVSVTLSGACLPHRGLPRFSLLAHFASCPPIHTIAALANANCGPFRNTSLLADPAAPCCLPSVSCPAFVLSGHGNRRLPVIRKPTAAPPRRYENRTGHARFLFKQQTAHRSLLFADRRKKANDLSPFPLASRTRRLLSVFITGIIPCQRTTKGKRHEQETLTSRLRRQRAEKGRREGLLDARRFRLPASEWRRLRYRAGRRPRGERPYRLHTAEGAGRRTGPRVTSLCRLPEHSVSAGGSSLRRRASVPALLFGSIRLIRSLRIRCMRLFDRYVTGLFRACNVNLLVRCADSVIRSQKMIRSVSTGSMWCAGLPRHVPAFRLAPACRHSPWQGEGQALPHCIPTRAAARHVKTQPVFTLSGQCCGSVCVVEVRP